MKTVEIPKESKESREPTKSSNVSVNDLLAQVKKNQIAKREALSLTDVSRGSGHAVGYISINERKALISADDNCELSSQFILEFLHKNK